MEIEEYVDEFEEIYRALKERELGLSERSLASMAVTILRERVREAGK